MPFIPFHAQDEFLYCGVACGQMLLHWHSRNLRDPGIFTGGQMALHTEITRSPGGVAGVEVSSSQLCSWLNSHWKSPAAAGSSPAGGAPGTAPWAVAKHTWQHDWDTSEPTAVFTAMEACFDLKLPCVSLRTTKEHWVVVTGRSQSRSGLDDVITFLDPWLETDADGSDPRQDYPHQRRDYCGCANRTIMSWSLRTIHGQRRFVPGRVLGGWPFGRKDQTWSDMKNDIRAARMPVSPTQADLATYAIVPREAAGVPFSAAPRPLSRNGPPPDVEDQVEEAGLTGAGAPEPWATLGSGAPVESRDVFCERNAALHYRLHFWPRAARKRQWLAAITTEDGWLLETAIVHGRRPSLAGAEAAATAAVQAAKTIRMASGGRVRPAQCHVEALPGLVWIPCAQTAVPFLPLVKVKLTRRSNGVEEGTVYVSLSGRIHATLTA